MGDGLMVNILLTERRTWEVTILMTGTKELKVDVISKQLR